MGLHGKYGRVVTHLRNWTVICLLLTGPMDALAQVSDRQISDELRQRRAERAARLDPYWDGFILKYQGNCEAAITKLHPIAALGLGYEEAQTALGECLLTLAGMPEDRTAPPTRDMIFAKGDMELFMSTYSKERCFLSPTSFSSLSPRSAAGSAGCIASLSCIG